MFSEKKKGYIYTVESLVNKRQTIIKKTVQMNLGGVHQNSK